MTGLLLALLVTEAAASERSKPTAEDVVRTLERAWLDAYEQLDSAAMQRIVADDFLITFPDGATQSKAQILAYLATARARPSTPPTRFHTEGTTARAYGNTVILSGVVVTTSTRNGKPTESRSRYTDTYVSRNGHWQVVASHLSNVPEPRAANAAGTDTVRFVRDHTLVSRSLPRTRIDVDPRLAYVGALTFELKQAAQVQRHVFAERDEQGTPRRLLIVQFESILPAAKGSYTFRVENPTRLGAHDYQTDTGFFDFVEAATARPGAEAEQTTTFLAGMGLQVKGEAFLVARHARIVDPEKRSEIILFYYENLRELDRTRQELDAGGARASELPGLLRDVAARAKAAFKVHDPVN